MLADAGRFCCCCCCPRLCKGDAITVVFPTALVSQDGDYVWQEVSNVLQILRSENHFHIVGVYDRDSHHFKLNSDLQQGKRAIRVLCPDSVRELCDDLIPVPQLDRLRTANGKGYSFSSSCSVFRHGKPDLRYSDFASAERSERFATEGSERIVPRTMRT